MEKKVGLITFATGDYARFIPAFERSAREYFFGGDFDLTVISEPHLPSPLTTLLRYHHILNMDFKNEYLFMIDIDSMFVAPVGDEILSERVGTLHPGFVFQEAPYETWPQSSAYMDRGNHYYAGGFVGGTRSEFLTMAKTIAERIDKDLKRNYIARFHDESHLNKYFEDFKPTKVLTPSYCYPEDDERYIKELWKEPYEKKIVMLDKWRK